MIDAEVEKLANKMENVVGAMKGASHA